jgi:signal transduction histidine kinase
MHGRFNVQTIAVKTRLRIVFATIFLMMLLGGLLSFLQFRNVSAYATRLARVEQRASTLLRLHNALLHLMSELHRSAHDHNADTFSRDARRLLGDFDGDTQGAPAVLDATAQESDRHFVLVGSIRAMLSNLAARIQSFIRLAEAGDWAALDGRLLNQQDQTDDVVTALMQQVDADLATARTRLKTDLDRAQDHAAKTLVATAVLSAAIAAVLGGLLTRSITKPLSRLTAAAGALAAGDFTQRAEVRGRDELARLSEAFNVMAHRLAGMFEEVRSEHASAEAARAALQDRARELSRANGDLQQFAYSASHDLQEPLRTVITYSQLLHRKYSARLDGAANEYMQYLVNAAEQMDRLISDLLEYSRLASVGSAEDVITDADAVMTRVLTAFQGRMTAQGATVQCAALARVRAHEVHVQQLFQNLLGNALKYRSQADPVIEVWSEEKGSFRAFAVRDNGIGIPAQYRQQVFGLFKRLHGQSYPGTGIGLAICQRIVEGYGGSIWVDSEVANGSTFWFTLPAATEAEVSPGTPQ